jgi:hypothetical protein
MQFQGRDIYENIRQEAGQRSQTVAALNNEISGAEQQIAAAVSLREQTLSKLAEKYVAARDDQNVAALIREASQTVNKLFQEKARRRDQLNAAIQQFEDEAGSGELAVPALTGKIEVLDHKWAAICVEIDKQLSEAPETAVAQQTVAQLQKRIERTSAAVVRSTDIKTKFAKDYEKDPVFAYLLAREQKPRANPLTSSLDNWLKRASNFERNAKVYHRIQSLPGRLQKSSDEARKEIEAARAEIQKRRGVLIDARVPIAERTEYAGLTKERNTVLEKSKALRTQSAKVAAERQVLDSQRSPYEECAKKAVRDVLSRQAIAEMKKTAAATSDPEDDQLVGTIEECENRIDRLREQVKEAKRKRDEAFAAQQKAQELANWFTANNYNNSRSYFKGFDAGNFLTGYLVGTIAENVLHSAFRSSQYFTYPPNYQSGGGFNLGGGSGFGGGGFGGGGFSGGSDGGGGFGGGGGGGGGSDGGGGGGFSSTDSFGGGGGFGTTDSF